MKSKKTFRVGIIIILIILAVCFSYICIFTDFIITPKYIYSSDFNDMHYDIKQKVSIDELNSIEITNSDCKFTLRNLKYCNNLSEIIVYTHDCYDDMEFLTDLKNIEFLSATCKSNNWYGISQCKKLKYVHLYESDFSDLSLFSGFSELSELMIESEKQIEYNGLDTLISLEKLVLSVPNVDIKEISKAEGIINLDFHCLSQITNIEYISNMTKLKSLYFGACDIDYKILQSLSNQESLEKIYFSNCKFNFDEEQFENYLNKISCKGIDIEFENNKFIY